MFKIVDIVQIVIHVTGLHKEFFWLSNLTSKIVGFFLCEESECPSIPFPEVKYSKLGTTLLPVFQLYV